MRYRYEFRLLREQFFIFGHDQLAGLITRDDLDHRTGFLRYELPRNYVCMMLEY